MKRIRKLFSIWMVLTLMVQAIAMAGVGPVAVAQGPSGGEKHHVPPRPDLFQIIQEGEDAGARLNAASDDPADAEAAFRDYLATKLQGYGGGIAQDAGSGVGLSQVANSRLLVVLVDLDDATHNNIPYVPPADLPYDYWYSDFDYTHYDRMLFDTTNIWSLRNWVREASDNLFDLQGQIYDGAGTDIDGWVALTNDLTDYGEDDPGGGVDNVGANDLFQFVRDAADEINSAWLPLVAGGTTTAATASSTTLSWCTRAAAKSPVAVSMATTRCGRPAAHCRVRTPLTRVTG